MRFALILLIAIDAFAQTNAGQLSGRILDLSNAAVRGAIVTAMNIATSQTAEVYSDESGIYSFPGLLHGTYNLHVEANGFRIAEEIGIVIDGASRRSVDFRLEVGQITERVTVAAAPGEEVKTTSGDVSKTITERELSSFALNGRNYLQLLRLVPGAVSTGGDVFGLNLSTTGQRINGIRSNSIYFLMDGTDNMDNGTNASTIVNPNVDAIVEIKILTSSYSAEFGGRSGALVNVVSRSGTRDFHGTLFEFIRNDAWDARSFFATTNPPLRFHDFGWSLGGPVYIPGRWITGRNKLFFFGSQEWRMNRRGEARVSTVPTEAERMGDFNGSSLVTPNDPTNDLPFANRIVPQSRWSKNGPPLLKPYPEPNYTGPGGNYSVNGINVTDTREDLFRADYYINSAHSLMYRYTRDSWDIFEAWQGTNMGFVPGGRPRPGYTTVLGYQSTLSPTSLNSFSFSVTKNSIQGIPANDVLKRSTLGLNYPEIFPINSYMVGPNVSIAGFTGYNVGDRIRNGNTTFMWRDDFSKVLGPHTLKFGAQIFRSRKDQNAVVTDNSSVTFNTTALNTSRNVIADVLLGNFQNYTEGQQDTAYFARFNQTELYAQDNWRVTRRLTLEFGLRWQIIEPTYSALSNFTTFLPEQFDPAKSPRVDPISGHLASRGDPYNGIFILGDGWTDAARGRLRQAFDPRYDRLFAGLPRGSYPISYRNFGPRFGFAYDPFGTAKTSIRGGFGIFYDLMRSDLLGSTSANPPFANSANLFDGNIDNPRSGGAPAPGNLTFISTTMKQPVIYSYNLNIQRELPFNVILDIGYVGTLGRRLTRAYNINQLQPGTRLSGLNAEVNVNALRPYPGYANLTFLENGDTSHYDSMQVVVSRRIKSGLHMSANYTLSKTMESSGGGFQDIYAPRMDVGLSTIHRAHVANISYVYELPFFRRNTRRWIRNIAGGWDISGITSIQSGSPNSVTVPADIARNGSSSSRATVIGNPNLPNDQRTLSRWFNTEAFLDQSLMTPGMFGNTGRNILIGPGQSQWDVALLKNIEFTNRTGLQFRCETFNLPNHASFTGLNTVVRFDSNGKPSQNYGSVNASNPGRVLSFGLKFLF